MKKKLIITISISIFLLLNSFVYATQLQLNTDYTQDYKRYLEATEEEKKKYTVIPNQYKIIDSKKEVTNPIVLMNRLGAANDPYFSLKDTLSSNIIIKNQKNLTLCWSFATLSALSTHLALKNVTNQYDFSARHMDYAAVKDTLDGTNTNPFGLNRLPGTTANWGVAVNYLTNGLGAIKESTMPLNYSTDLLPLADVVGKRALTEVYDVKMYPQPNTAEEKNNLINEVKTNIRLYGAVPAQICGSDLNNNEYYNSTTGALFYPESSGAQVNHAVAIIGWDDNYEISKFNSNHIPPEKGAWIVQNSWGTEVGDGGLIYVSYYDRNISNGLIQITNAVDKDSSTYKKKFDNRYMHDQQGFGPALKFESTNKVWLGSKFTAYGDNELLSMLSVSVLNSSQCKAYVNTQSDSFESLTPVKFKSGDYTATIEPGYHSLELETPIKLTSPDRKFAIVLELSNVSQSDSTYVFIEQKSDDPSSVYNNVDVSKKSYITDQNGFTNNQWINLGEAVDSDSGKSYNADTTVRAYTLDEAPTQKTLTGIKIERGPNKTVYNAGDSFDTTGMIVKALYNDNTSDTVEDYVVNNGTNLSSGQSSVTISYNGYSTEQSITVKGSSPEQNIVPGNLVPDNSVPDQETDKEPQNSVMNNLKPVIVKFTSNSIDVKVDNFIQNKNNDSMAYSFYITPNKNEDVSTLKFIKIDNYQISGNSIQFSITKEMNDLINSKYNWESEEKTYLIIKEVATLSNKTKTAYSVPAEFDFDDNIIIQLEDEISQKSDYYIEDDTVAKTPIPQTGTKTVLLAVLGVGILGILLLSRYIILKRTFNGK